MCLTGSAVFSMESIPVCDLSHFWYHQTISWPRELELAAPCITHGCRHLDHFWWPAHLWLSSAEDTTCGRRPMLELTRTRPTLGAITLPVVEDFVTVCAVPSHAVEARQHIQLLNFTMAPPSCFLHHQRPV